MRVGKSSLLAVLGLVGGADIALMLQHGGMAAIPLCLMTAFVVWVGMATMLEMVAEEAVEHRAPFDRAAEALASLPRFRPLRGDEITSCD